ncbi:hypothetical protein LEP1GSC016_4288 [Leptospira borgpetersenii serovar Hardjo-bovis str. Sponselee]|uniref:Uncharacterized protein n=1 Tax=Leptospira borgpetersenii serovar Hardjo-bovis str. Sponselee TaxID=1303729 RepID=M6C742_LEPBO|nr:hypothetical protein LEP1GSC016_4288 [Leptospira borgpetersenii serovar Hardjo-bovis str. Sponselee]
MIPKKSLSFSRVEPSFTRRVQRGYVLPIRSTVEFFHKSFAL